MLFKKFRKNRDTRVYGHDRTIHRTGEVNVELDKKGNVVSVWYRCQTLPFTQTVVDDDRATSMTRMYENQPASFIEAIEFKD
jgi:hypothetical protein